MACSGCGRKAYRDVDKDIMEQYGYLNDRQLKARLEIYKKRYCKNCNEVLKCDYEMYLRCKKSK